MEARQAFAWELEAKSLLCHAVYALLLRHQHELRRGRPYAGADLQRLHALLRALNARYGEPLALEEMARIAGLSRESCCRFFKRMTGETLSQYLEEYRVAQGLALLQQGEMSVTEIALHCGFSNAGRFSAAFCRRMHCTPREFLSRCRSTYAPISTQAPTSAAIRATAADGSGPRSSSPITAAFPPCPAI